MLDTFRDTCLGFFWLEMGLWEWKGGGWSALLNRNQCILHWVEGQKGLFFFSLWNKNSWCFKWVPLCSRPAPCFYSDSTGVAIHNSDFTVIFIYLIIGCFFIWNKLSQIFRPFLLVNFLWKLATCIYITNSLKPVNKRQHCSVLLSYLCQIMILLSKWQSRASLKARQRFSNILLFSFGHPIKL